MPDNEESVRQELAEVTHECQQATYRDWYPFVEEEGEHVCPVTEGGGDSRFIRAYYFCHPVGSDVESASFLASTGAPDTGGAVRGGGVVGDAPRPGTEGRDCPGLESPPCGGLAPERVHGHYLTVDRGADRVRRLGSFPVEGCHGWRDVSVWGLPYDPAGNVDSHGVCPRWLPRGWAGAHACMGPGTSMFLEDLCDLPPFVCVGDARECAV